MRRSWILLALSVGCVTVDKDTKFADTGTTTTTSPDGPPTVSIDSDGDADGFPASEDCDDGNSAVNPAAVEACDGIDNNCDEGVDDEFAATVEGGGTFATVDEAVAATMTNATGYEGIDPLPSGIVTICPGTWTTAPIVYGEGNLTLRSVTGRETTGLSALNGETLVSVDDGGFLTIEGLTLSGSNDAALVIQGDSSVTLTSARLTANGQGLFVFGEDRQGGEVHGAVVVMSSVDFDNNNGGLDGGGASLQGTFVATLTDVSFVDNVGANGGGLYLATYFGPTTLSLVNVEVRENTANGDGGGVYSRLVPFVGDDTTQVTGNTALGSGGGFAVMRATVQEVLVSGNHATAGGGVAALYDPFLSTAPNPGEMEAVVIDSNTAEEGAGIWVDENELVSLRSSSKVTLNTATTRGGGIMLAGDDSYATSDFADFGLPGVDDNAPDDIFVYSWGALFYGDDASFLCSTVAFCETN